MLPAWKCAWSGHPPHRRGVAGQRAEDLLCESGHLESPGEAHGLCTGVRHRREPVSRHAGEAGCAEGADGEGYVRLKRRPEEKGPSRPFHLRTHAPSHLGRADELHRHHLPNADRGGSDRIPAHDPVCGA